MAFARFATLAFVLCIGCGTSNPGTDAGPPPFDAGTAAPSVELGTGVSAFEAIPETGAELELVRGPQGGHHVFLTARFRGLNPEGMTLTFTAVDTATGSVVRAPASFNLVLARVRAEGDAYVRVGDFLILEDMENPDAVRGLTLDITVLAEEAGTGRSATDHRVVLIVDNEMG